MARNNARNAHTSRKSPRLTLPHMKDVRRSPLEDASNKANLKLPHRSLREFDLIQPVGKHRKPRQTVSVAGIFKQPKPNAREKKQRRRREPTPEPDLLLDLQDGIETARSDMLANATARFKAVYASFTTGLATARSSDMAFFDRITREADTLNESLADELIEVATSKGGKRVGNTYKIGERVEKFKKLVVEEETRLSEAWKQWEEVQDEFLELGVEVFGEERFGEDGRAVVKKAATDSGGWKREMELLDLEHGTKVRELMDEEIEEVKMNFLKSMKASEKEQDAMSKKDTARLLQALMEAGIES